MPAATASIPAVTTAADILLRWPAREPLAALVSGGSNRTHNGWSIFARPSETVVIPANAGRDEVRSILTDAFARTPRMTRASSRTDANSQTDRRCPFDGGWIVALGYGLGAAFEDALEPRTDARDPIAVLHWCEDAWIVDHASGEVAALGEPPALNEADGTHARAPRRWAITGFDCSEGDARYAANVARTVEYIRAGDAFQANIARRFTARLEGSPRAFAHEAITSNGAWFGTAIDLPSGGALVSMSPELFLRVGPDGSVTTRPIKGTRPATADARELMESGKDAAELAMIVDLMRNDLGRVADIGTVAVRDARVLETHSTVHHGVAEVVARLRDDVTWLDLLAATFPPGSVTGAPKVRAMQIIDGLESSPRGFYCGAMGFIARSGHASLNVAIRTAQLGRPDDRGERPIAYHAGCGIVVESEPDAEVAETLAKARAIARFVQ
ncbi:MAG: anthranilate synthase component I family protein [bacterium]